MAKTTKPDVLFFKSEGEGHALGYSYWSIAKDEITIREGDALEYDIFIDINSPLIQSGVDIHFKSGRCMRDSGITDQLGNGAHPIIYLYDAKDTWFHRTLDLSKLAGETVQSVEIAFVGHLEGTYMAAFKNIAIVRNGAVRQAFYQAGEPHCLEQKMRTGFKNDVIKAIEWDEFWKVKVENIDPYKLSAEIKLAEKLLGFFPDKKAEWQPLIQRAKSELDIEAYKQHELETYMQSKKRVISILEPILKEVRAFTTHLIGHAHIDMNWLWVWDETVAVCQRDFDTMSRLMEQYPFFRFSQSQGSVYKAVQKTRPDLFERIKYFINKGQWEVTAAMWVEGDENMASNEALVRQFLLAKRYTKKHFGIESVVCWQPDLFGHVWTMPQILQKAGVKYYYHMRCPKASPMVYWWQGPDGSRVLAATTPNYNGSITPDTPYEAINLFEKQGVKDFLHSYGVGDHGGGPTIRDIARALELQKNPSLPTLKFNTVRNYFETIEANYQDLPVVNDELQFIFEGCYTTHADIKLRNRICENTFAVLELFSVMALPFEVAYPTYILNEGWERTCFNHFHDILPGSGIHPAAQELLPITDGVIEAGKAALRECLTTLASQIHTADFATANPLVVFNPSNWNRDDIVKMQLPLFPGEWVEVVNEQDEAIPSQIVSRTPNDAEVIFVATAVPAMGYKTYGWRKISEQPVYDTELKVSDELTFESAYYKMKFDAASGCMTNLMLKETRKELIEPGSFGNRFQLLKEKAGEMSAWTIGEILETRDMLKPVRIEVLERGPVRALLQVVHRDGKSEFVQRMAVYHNLRRIDFPCTVDWQEIGTRQTGSKMLKVAFPLNLSRESTATFEIPFGTIAREASGHEYPTQKWMDVSDSGYGISLLNDCKYGCDVNENVMRLSLLRCSYEPDPIPDKGVHHFTYSLVPHFNDWKTALTLRSGYELNQPLMPMITDAHEGKLPPEIAYVRCSAENVIITALKKAEEGDALILRCYETHGTAVETEFEFAINIVNAVETNLLEQELEGMAIPCSGNRFKLSLGAHEIKTVKIQREGFTWKKQHGFVDV
ncbi:alpha-mannosidase [candidate division KSB1 bacterium]|nr:alpha-mannosidase [candidate division KSB1 bacterium]